MICVWSRRRWSSTPSEKFVQGIAGHEINHQLFPWMAEVLSLPNRWNITVSYFMSHWKMTMTHRVKWHHFTA